MATSGSNHHTKSGSKLTISGKTKGASAGPPGWGGGGSSGFSGVAPVKETEPDSMNTPESYAESPTSLIKKETSYVSPKISPSAEAVRTVVNPSYWRSIDPSVEAVRTVVDSTSGKSIE
jgi:hypothetical protein